MDLGKLNSLSPDEIGLFSEIGNRIGAKKQYNQTRTDYYEAHRRVKDLGVSIPPQLKNTAVAIGWPAMVVDSLEERLEIDGFVIPGGDVDALGINEMWADNELEVEHHEAHIAALIHGVSFLAISRGIEGEPDPMITVESPTTMSGIYDPRRRRLSAAASVAWNDENDKIVAASMYLPNQNIRIELGSNGKWGVIDRDFHNAGRVLVRSMVNKKRSDKHWGSSEITPTIIYNTDAAMRTLLGAEVSREFYNSPQRYILGADEDAFTDAQGNPTNAWKSYMGRFLALTANEDGDIPTVGQFATSSPMPYIELVKMHAQLVSGEAALPPTYMGFVTENPASADQIRMTENRHVKRAERRQVGFGATWRGAIKDGLLLRDGKVPDELSKLKLKWRDAATPTKAAAADSVTKQIAAGVLTPDGEVTYEQLGYDTTDIARLQADARRARVATLTAGVGAAATAARQDPAVAALSAQRTA